MQVLPHMREAGGGLAHFPPTSPSHARRGQQAWDANVGTSRGQQSWAEARLVVGKLGFWGYLPFDGDSLRNACAF